MHYKHIKISDYSYELPEERIAKYPLPERDNSKLLTYKHGKIKESKFTKIAEELSENSLLVFNNTKVIKARLQFKKPTGATIEVFCIEPYLPSDYATALRSTKTCHWKCLIGNKKRWKESVISMQTDCIDKKCTFNAEIIRRLDDAFIIKFSWDNELYFSDILISSGAIPIPPYLNRDSETIDELRYQTVFSKYEGSVAAPTAGLHFTNKLLDRLDNQGITRTELTLHVGAGTFKPVKHEMVEKHNMHTEYFSFSRKLITHILNEDIQIIAVGTTAVRSLESIYQIGAKLLSNTDNPLHISQWEAYELPKYSKKNSLEAVLKYMKQHDTEVINAKTDILIMPSYKFTTISGMITNFHQPKSTLLLLIASLVGKDWKKIYRYALENDFRFLSYGDSSLLFTK